MSVDSWSTNPDQNGAIEGINIAEGCPAQNLNNSVRAIAAAIKAKFDSLPASGGDYMPKGGGVFSGGISFAGRGSFLHHNDPANTSGRVFIQATGGATPTGMANGDLLLEY